MGASLPNGKVMGRGGGVTTQSFMKTCVFTLPHAIGLLVADRIPYTGSHDTRVGRDSSWPQVPSGIHGFWPLRVMGGFSP